MKWLNTSKKEEVDFSNRIYQLEHLQSEPKLKAKESKCKDQAIATIVTPHKSGEITIRQLLDKYINLESEQSLPRELKHIEHTFI